MTRSEFETMKKELEMLITVKRPEVAEKLRKVRALGDLADNPAYHEAKREQVALEMRIIELEQIIDGLEVVEE